MIKISEDVKKQLIEYSTTKGIYIEGNILKVIDTSNDKELATYVETAINKDSDARKKRLEMTKQVQAQNIELTKWKTENEKINAELKKTIDTVEKAKETALNDLDVLQKKTQSQLIESIVKVSLWIICGIGITTTGIFIVTLLNGIENKIVESMWSNMFGILLTNCFSIIGTIMGIKYASNKSNTKECECRKRKD